MGCSNTVLRWTQGYRLPIVNSFYCLNSHLRDARSKSSSVVLDLIIKDLLRLHAVVEWSACHRQFLFPVFLADETNGTKRFILNLKKLNKFIVAPHFKMEDYRKV